MKRLTFWSLAIPCALTVGFLAAACKTTPSPPPAPAAGAKMEMAAAAAAKPPCQPTLEDCPVTGCATDNTPNKALLNTLKHKVPSSGSPTLLTFDDFALLQSEAKSRLGNVWKATVHRAPSPDDAEEADDPPETDSSLDSAHRDLLHNVQVSGGATVSEQDYVAIVGHIVGNPRANTGGESVNCRLTGTQPNDFHIPVSPQPQSDFGNPKDQDKDEARRAVNTAEVTGVIVELIPQHREPGWSLPALKKLRDDDTRVLVVGQLLFDDEHFPNTDAEKKGGQPRRFTVWEVHPVKEIRICPASGSCTLSNSTKWVGGE